MTTIRRLHDERLSAEDEAAIVAALAAAPPAPLEPGSRPRIPKSALWKHGGTWRFRYDAGRNANGRRYRPTVALGRCRDRAAAERAAVRFLASRPRLKRGAALITWGAFSPVYREQCVPRLGDGTQASAASVIVRHLDPRFSNLPLHAVREHVQPWIDEQIGVGVPLSTARHRFKVLAAALAEAVRRELLGAEHVPKDVIWPRAPRVKRPRDLLTFTLDEQTQILGAAKGALRSALALGFYVGFRPAESSGLEWRDVELSDRRLAIRQQARGGRPVALKTPSSNATMTMPTALVAILATQYRQARREGLQAGRTPRFVLENADGAPLSTATLRTRELYPLLDALGLARRGLHACRRAFADRLLAAGTPITEIQTALRHATLAATQAYLSEGQPAAVAAAIERAARLAKLDASGINRASADIIEFPDAD